MFGSPEVEDNVVEIFRTHHHAIAQLIAFGCTDSMIQRRTGVSKRRLTLLRGSPAFAELVAHYEKRRDEDFSTTIDPFRDLAYQNMMRGELTVAEHFERHEDEGTLMPVSIANRVAQERADRLGYSKHSVVHHEHDFAGALDRAISRSASVMIEGKAVEERPLHGPASLPTPEPVQENPGSPTPPEPARLSIASVQRMEYMRRKFVR